MDNLRHRVEHEGLGGNVRYAHDHGDGVDDGGGVKCALHENVPDLADVAELDEEGGEAKGKPNSEDVELDDDERSEEDVPVEIYAVDEGEDEDNTEVDDEVDQCADGGGDDDDVFREVDFTEEVAAIDDAHHTLPGGFGEERPEDLTEE